MVIWIFVLMLGMKNQYWPIACIFKVKTIIIAPTAYQYKYLQKTQLLHILQEES